jgi:hypothetical protein
VTDSYHQHPTQNNMPRCKVAVKLTNIDMEEGSTLPGKYRFSVGVDFGTTYSGKY